MQLSTALAETLMRRFPNPDDFPFRSWCYPQGFMLWGFIHLFAKTGDERYSAYVLDYCNRHVDEQGDIIGFSGASLDDIMAGSVLVWAYKQTGSAKYEIACQRIRRVFDEYPRNRNGGFWHGLTLPGEMWVDGVFMGLMFLTRYGKEIDDTYYCYQETVKQLSVVFDCCEKDHTGLLYHAYSDNPNVVWAHPISGKAQEVWCEGLGWYALILVEALEMLPKTQLGYERLVMQLRKLAEGLQKVQDSTDGLWYQVVDKPRMLKNWKDTSGSAMFLYAIHKAMRLGLLDAGYEEVCRKAFEGVKSKCRLDTDGNVNVFDACDGLCVQADYDAYVYYPRSVNCKEAVAAVLWAATEMES